MPSLVINYCKAVVHHHLQNTNLKKNNGDIFHQAVIEKRLI